jgi:hypothetical protein
MFFLSLFISLALAESTLKAPCEPTEMSEACTIAKETAVVTPPISTPKSKKQKKKAKMPASTSAK